VKGISRKAPIRLIDAWWGNLKNEETHRKKYASWRRNLDATVIVVNIFLDNLLTGLIGAKGLVQFFFLY